MPASPALAASIEAFNASKLVWSAISSMVLITAKILLDDSEISSIAFNNCPIFSLLMATSSLISPVSSFDFPIFSTLSLIRPTVLVTASLKSAILCICWVQFVANELLAFAISSAPLAT